MIDPLSKFDWRTLYERYDELCTRYRRDSRCLERFGSGSERPKSDRELYYRLIDLYAPAERASDCDVVGTYIALLYWKLYSTLGEGTDNTILERWRLKPNGEKRDTSKSAILELFKDRAPLSRDSAAMAKRLAELPQIPGMGAKDKGCPTPVRSTFLHFLYPSVAPIFDKVVLEAVRESSPAEAVCNIDKFQEYTQHVWKLADGYEKKIAPFRYEESPVRLIEMALWITRGS